MFKIIDCERLPEDRFRLVVETEDSSLFTALSFLDSLVEFTGSFRYKAKIALSVKDRLLTQDVRFQAAKEDRAKILELYEALNGPPKERWHTILDSLKNSGRDWMVQDDVIVMLTLARSERKESQKRIMDQERKKSA